MNNTKNSILITYFSIIVKGKKHYCTPAPNTTIGLLEKFHNIEIGRRWFFQCTYDLERAGYITRVKRQIYTPEAGVISRPSLIALTVRGFKYLRRKGVHRAQEMLKPMFRWLRRDDQRRPTVADLYPDETITDREAAITKLKELIKDIGHGPAGGNAPATT